MSSRFQAAITKTAAIQYVISGGNHCPFCGSTSIAASGRQDREKLILQSVACATCKRQWTDIFSMTDVAVPSVTCAECQQVIKNGAQVEAGSAGFRHARCPMVHADKQKAPE